VKEAGCGRGEKATESEKEKEIGTEIANERRVKHTDWGTDSDSGSGSGMRTRKRMQTTKKKKKRNEKKNPS